MFVFHKSMLGFQGFKASGTCKGESPLCESAMEGHPSCQQAASLASRTGKRRWKGSLSRKLPHQPRSESILGSLI